MDKIAAVKLIKDTFENRFDKERFVYFVKNLLNHIEDSTFNYRGNLIPDAFKPYISSFERVGKFLDKEDKKIDVLIVNLKKETSLERARTMQRNFIARYLNGSRGGILKDAALTAFVSPDKDNWRFSLIKMDYKFDKKGKVKEEFTPARRYSFIVGENENSHTAQSRLVPLLINDKVDPLLNELEQAFSIERVTKEFFEKYRELFLRLKESLEELIKKDSKIKKDFKDKNINTNDFAKKTLGQIVFLYFLQKKGWFGVKRGQAWGKGSPHFLRELFKKRHPDYKNFFNDILEPLFYEALRNDRSYDHNYYSRFDCRIPFLNGGLFDPINDYDWVNTEIDLPNDLFSNERKTKEGDKGDGILDVFDRYNFTVKEDEPLEKEVAVDPEMLGKVFENLLAVKDRKSKGTYYTPREIVHYMCEQSLINYLATELEKKVSKEDVEKLIKFGETTSEHDAIFIRKIAENSEYNGVYKKAKLPSSIKKNAKLIDDMLKDIKVCDPAVGSGAFPVGMMHEIIKARTALNPYLCKNLKEGYCVNRSVYDFKRDCIQNSLYGVDIDPGAIEIAKLRLWLSLVVDEQDIGRIKPLPNLDYKLVCGNSLLGVDKQDMFIDIKLKQLEEVKQKFFNETEPKKKKEYKKQIDNLISDITKGHKIFDFEIYFSEVFHKKKGFDVVIANPPYINIEKLDVNLKNYLFQFYKTCSGRTDIYIAFIEMSLKILRDMGTMTYIIPYAFTNQKYGTSLRKLLIENHHIKEIVDTSEYFIFDKAIVKNIILQIIKNGIDTKTVIKHAVTEENFDKYDFIYFAINQKDFLNLKDYRFETKNITDSTLLKQKIDKKSLKFSDICFIAYGARLNHKSKAVKKEAYIFKKPFFGFKPYHEGKNVEKYKLSQSGWLNYVTSEHYNPMFPELFENKK